MSQEQSQSRPLITFALIAYNQEDFITDAIKGALSQTYSPLQIILSDDCSSDTTFEIIETLAKEYQGSHELILNRNVENKGLAGHINHIMTLARGELIVIAAGDDISLPQRTQRIYEYYIKSQKRSFSIFTNAICINDVGEKIGILHKLSIPPQDLTLESYASRERLGFITGSTHAWQKTVFDFFGPLPNDVQAEDTVIPFRSALLGSIGYIHEPLVYYRTSSERFKQKGFYSLSLYRKMEYKELITYQATYHARLRDIQHYIDVVPSSTINRLLVDKVIIITKKRQANLKSTPLFKSLGNFIKLCIYFEYRKLRSRLQLW